MYGKVSQKNRKYFNKIRKFNVGERVVIVNGGPYSGNTAEVLRSRRNIKGAYFYDLRIDSTGERATMLEKEIDHAS